ncbi:MAG: DUF2914 domain-containing protein [Candidatus Paceibacterota bacterium]|jgi:hypothetical protein|nr:DUF2914 domain-containing protein [Candidatus Paceibacterota bacterium]
MSAKKLSIAYWKKWMEENERLATVVFFAIGFVFDSLTLSRIDNLLDMTILFGWLFVASAGVIAVDISRFRESRFKFLRKENKWLEFIVPFSLGNLFSGVTIFYSRSASFLVSWPFLIIIIALFIGNEFFKKRYLRLNFQISILFATVYFLMIPFVPIIIGNTSDSIFLLSGAISLLAIGAFIHFLYFFLPREARANRIKLTSSIGGIFIAVNFFYFTNLIPPLPLSLKDAGIYHYMERTASGKYFFQKEIKKPFDVLDFYEKIHVVQGESLYFYSAVFSPTRLNTNIIHSWQYYDPKADTWVVSANIRFPIYGGADGGYRGYSEKTNIFPGKWRVDVTNERGQVLGRERFEIISVERGVPLESVIK